MLDGGRRRRLCEIENGDQSDKVEWAFLPLRPLWLTRASEHCFLGKADLSQRTDQGTGTAVAVRHFSKWEGLSSSFQGRTGESEYITLVELL